MSPTPRRAGLAAVATVEAIYALTGKRIRQLPIDPALLKRA